MSEPTTLPPITDRSYGLIPIRFHPSCTPFGVPTALLPVPVPRSVNTQLLLIHQRTILPLPDNKPYWCFPKGHPEPYDKGILESAIREVEEETGLTVSPSSILYFKSEKGDVVEFKERYVNPIRRSGKEVQYWPALISSEGEQEQEVKVQEKEVVDAQWYTWDEALSLITFDECRDMLRNLQALLDAGQDESKGKLTESVSGGGGGGGEVGKL